MNIITVIAISIVILLHFLFFVLEMFMWDTPFGRKTFGLSEEYAKKSAPLAANQGLYNGFLAAGLLWGLVSTGGYDALVLFLSFIFIAGIYGAITAKVSILWLQTVPAGIAMILLFSNS
jgi:putative membrane protein